METLKTIHLPLGFGFHPTDAELVSHYLRRKLLGHRIEFEVIPEVDIYKHEPWDLPSKSNVPTEDTKWHFFAARDRKYPNGTRSNRATKAGYWKSTGKDRKIKSVDRVVGIKKTLVFHMGRPPQGKRTDWIMHEYYMDERELNATAGMKDTFVLCRVTKRDGFPSRQNIVDGNDSCPDKQKGMSKLKEESSSPFATVDDNEAWCRELYDPDFCAVLGDNEEPFNLSYLPNVSDDQTFLMSDEDMKNILEFEPDGRNTNSSVDRGTTAAASNILISNFAIGTAETLSGCDSSPKFDSSISNGSSSSANFMNRNDEKDGFILTDPECIGTGIEVRGRYGRSKIPDIQHRRIRLQIKKLEMRSNASTKTLQMINRDQSCDVGHCGDEYHGTPNSERGSFKPQFTEKSRISFDLTASQLKKEITEKIDGEEVISQIEQLCISGPHCLQKRKQARLTNVRGSLSAHSDNMDCVQYKVPRGICLFLHKFSPATLNCLIITGTAALLLYFMMQTLPSLLGITSFGF